MKLVYEKPMMAVERYELTQTIAACITKIGWNNSDCVKNDEDAPAQMKDFAWSNGFIAEGGCIKVAQESDQYNGICYHTNANATFTS